jgi:hypothetical protein
MTSTFKGDSSTFIEELHGKKVKAGETFGAAYIVGWFDSIDEMKRVYDRYKGKRRIVVEKDKFRLEERANHRGTENTEKKNTEKKEVEKGSADWWFSSLFFFSLCSL